MNSGSKDLILKKIKQALKQPVPVPFMDVNDKVPLFTDKNEELELLFAENFTKLMGKFAFCENESEMVQILTQLLAGKQMNKIYCREDKILQLLQQHQFAAAFHEELASCDASITTCEALIARTGSLLLSSATASGRTASVYAPVHICIAYTSQLVFDIKDGMELMQSKYGNQLPSMISLATGPSRTADIEKTLVVGIHGPKEVYCFLINS